MQKEEAGDSVTDMQSDRNRALDGVAGGEFSTCVKLLTGSSVRWRRENRLGPIHILNVPLTHSTRVNTPGSREDHEPPPPTHTHSYLRGLFAALLKGPVLRGKKNKKKAATECQNMADGRHF